MLGVLIFLSQGLSQNLKLAAWLSWLISKLLNLSVPKSASVTGTCHPT